MTCEVGIFINLRLVVPKPHKLCKAVRRAYSVADYVVKFAFADVLIYNYAVYGKNSNSDRWFPLCYVYDGEYDTIFQKTASTLISREIAERWMKIFGYSTLEEFKQKIAEINELIQKQVRVRRGYNAAFTEAQLLGDFIKPDDLGKLR